MYQYITTKASKTYIMNTDNILKVYLSADMYPRFTPFPIRGLVRISALIRVLPGPLSQLGVQ